jgi:hypothetical protein
MLFNHYGEPLGAFGRYGSDESVGTEPRREEGRFDPKHMPTSYVERQNQTIRISMRRFTKLTGGF